MDVSTSYITEEEANFNAPESDGQLMCTTYSEEIFRQLCLNERKRQFCIRADFLNTHRRRARGQLVITSHMRSVVIDWLVDVQVKFKLLCDTLYLAIDIMDRFLQVRPSSERVHEVRWLLCVCQCLIDIMYFLKILLSGTKLVVKRLL